MKHALPWVALLLTAWIAPASAAPLTRTLTANGNWWDDGAWLDAASAAIDWEDGSDATVGLNGKTLTLDQNAAVGKLIFSNVNTGGTFTSAEGTVVTITDPLIELNGSNTGAPQFKAGLKLAGGGVVSVKGIGEAHKGGNGAGTEFDPSSASDITAYRLTSGVFRQLSETPFNGKPIIFAGGGLVQTAGSKNLPNALVIETSPACLRTYGSASVTVAGVVSNVNSSASVELRHTDGGNLYMKGDLSGFYGVLVETTSGNFRMHPEAIDTLHAGVSLRADNGQFYIQPERDVTFSSNITGNRSVYQEGGTSIVTFSGNYLTTGTYTIRTGALNLTGSMGSVLVNTSGAAMSGTGTVTGTVTANNGTTVKAGGLNIGTLVLQGGAKLEASTSAPLTLGNLTLNGTVTVTLPADFEEGDPAILFTLPDTVTVNPGFLTPPAEFRIAQTPAGDGLTLYSLASGVSPLSRTVTTASETWENPGAAVWEDGSGDASAWTDTARASVYLKRNTLTLQDDVTVDALYIYDEASGSATPVGTLDSADDAAVTLLTPFISMGTSGGSGSRISPRLTAALNVPLADGEKQELIVNSAAGTTGSGNMRFAHFLPKSVTGVSAMRLTGNGFLVNASDFPTNTIKLAGATLICTGSFAWENADLVLAENSYFRTYGGNTLTVKGTFKTQTANAPVLNFLDNGSHEFRCDMTGFSGRIRNDVNNASMYVSVHSDAVVPATVILDATGSGKIRFVAEADMSMAGTLMGSGAMNKTGSGSLTLTGRTDASRGAFTVDAGELILANDYTYGALTVKNNATLTVNGTLSAAATLQTGATLGGTGTITGALTIQTGTTLKPGATVNTLSIPGGSTIQIKADDTPFKVAALTLDATSENPIQLDLPPVTGQIVDYPLVTIPSDVTITPEVFAMPESSRLMSRDAGNDQKLWYIRQGRAGIYVILD